MTRLTCGIPFKTISAGRTGPVVPMPRDFRDLSLRIQISRRNNLEGCGLAWK
jgi:hypothetical protein